jgi:hypothetical protein
MSKRANPFVQEAALSLDSNGLFLKSCHFSPPPHEDEEFGLIG